MAFVHYLLGFVVLVAAQWRVAGALVDIISLVVKLLVAAGLSALPALLVVDGVLMMRRERRSLANALSLVTGLGLILFPVVLVVLLRHENPVTGSLAVGLLTAQACVSFLFLAFAAHTVLYAHLARRAPATAVIVLGGGLVKGRVPPLLAARLQRGVDTAVQHQGRNGRPVLVPTGGQGSDEPRPEGEAMAEWLRQHGVRDRDILVEDRARTTGENLRYSARLLEEHRLPGPYVVVTSNYHAPRAAMLARELGIDAQAIGAPTALYYWPSAYLREFVAVVLGSRTAVVLAGLVVVTMTALAWLSLSA